MYFMKRIAPPIFAQFFINLEFFRSKSDSSIKIDPPHSYAILF
jgi:hypothetical protein